MIRSLYTAATGMEAQQLRMDTTANNLANTNTTGFKRARAEFEELLSETVRGAAPADARGGVAPTPLQVGLGVRTVSVQRSFSQGDMLNTQNPLDVAIEGQGFLRVMRPSGELAYTRAGNLRIDGQGRLATQGGDLLDPELTVPPETTAVTISANGAISATIQGRDEPQELGNLELSTFTNPAGLLSLGHNLYSATPASGQPLNVRPGEQGSGTLAQGFLESSNVKAVEEMVDMISTQRAYELNSKVIQTADQMLQRLTSLR